MTPHGGLHVKLLTVVYANMLWNFFFKVTLCKILITIQLSVSFPHYEYFFLFCYISIHICHNYYSLKHYVEKGNTEAAFQKFSSKNNYSENVRNINRNTSAVRFSFRTRGKKKSHGFLPWFLRPHSEQFRFDELIFKKNDTFVGSRRGET